jgi:hypothetical protein
VLRRLAVLPAVVGLVLVLDAAPGLAASPWTIVPSPNPDNALNKLNAVTARSASDAWAVGQFGETAEEDENGGLALHWNGTAWTAVATPNPQLRNEELNGVSGASAGDVWAVGGISTTANNLPRLPWAIHWDGTRWSEVAVPSGPLGTGRGGLRGVAAISATNAWAVGRARSTAVLVEHWNGSAWSVTPTPAVNIGLNAVSAVSASNVWAVGDATLNADGTHSALIMHFDGAAWTVAANQVSVPADSSHHGLKAIASLGANDIWAVGTVADRLSVEQPLIQHWNGTRWTRVAAPPRPAGVTHYFLNGLAASGPTDLTAVGGQFRDDLTQDSMVLRWNGTAWSFEATPDSGATFDNLTGAAVTPGGGPVWAVGTAEPSGSVTHTLILRR